MIARVQEDNPPLERPQGCRDVVDWANQICARRNAERSFLLGRDFDDCKDGEAEAALKLRGGRIMVNRKLTPFSGYIWVATITGRGEIIWSESADFDTAFQGALLIEFVRADRCKRMPKPVVELCECGKPAVFLGVCRGCNEDAFYHRDHTGARLEGAE